METSGSISSNLIISMTEDVHKKGSSKRSYLHSKRRICVDDYASKFSNDFVVDEVLKSNVTGEYERVLVCRFCKYKITPRSDRIKEHLSSRKHFTNKEVARRRSAAADALHGTSSTSITALTPDQGVVLSKAPLKAFSLQFVGSVESKTSPQPPHNGQDLEDGQEEDQVRVVLKPLPNIGKNLLQFFLTGKFSDITIMCDGSIINCHKIILAGFSTYFEQLLREPQMSNSVVCLSCVRLSELRACLELMYSGEINVPVSELQGLVDAMLRLGIQAVLKGVGQCGTDGSEEIVLGQDGSETIETNAQGRSPNLSLTQITFDSFAQNSRLGAGGKCYSAKPKGLDTKRKAVSILKPMSEICLLEENRRKSANPRKLSKPEPPRVEMFRESEGLLNPLDIVQAMFSDDENSVDNTLPKEDLIGNESESINLQREDCSPVREKVVRSKSGDEVTCVSH